MHESHRVGADTKPGQAIQARYGFVSNPATATVAAATKSSKPGVLPLGALSRARQGRQDA